MPMRLRECISALKKLDREIRKFHPPNQSILHSNQYGFNETLRDVTSEEWRMIKGIIEQYELPRQLTCGSYGFTFHVYAHGKTVNILNRLIAIEDRQFPFPSAKKGFAGQEETLRKLKPIIRSRRNQRLLKQHGLEPPLWPIERYAY